MTGAADGGRLPAAYLATGSSSFTDFLAAQAPAMLPSQRPLPAGAGRKEIFAAFTDKLLPAAAKFKPEMVFVSAGFDSREGDPLGRFRLTDADFADLTRMMLGAAKEHAGGRLVSMLDGGYNLEGLASAAVAHVRILCEPSS